MSKIFYPPCQWLDPNTRDAKGHFYCEQIKTIAENMAELEEEDEQELLIERGICPHCGKPLR